MSEKVKTYKNTAVIALSSFVNILFSIIKNKVLAIYIGPTGLGRFGMLNDTMSFTATLALLGLSNSGVQAISEANTKGSEEVIKVYNSLSRFFISLALIFILIFIVIAPYISNYLVNDDYLTWPLRIVIFSLLFRVRSQVQNTLIVGLQKVRMLAKANIYNGLIVTAFSIPMAIIWKEQSIPYLIIIIPFVSWLISVTQVRKVLKELPKHRNRLSTKELKPIIYLGVATLYGGFLENIVNLLMKGGIIRNFNESYLGYYHVAIGITMMYISFITSSISNDYYPRLVAKISEGREAVSEFVNQQIGISMHLIMPVLLAMLTFSEEIIVLLFSKEFLTANSLIVYSIAGTLLKVISWPIAYVFLAHRSTKQYLVTEFIGNGSHLVLVFVAFYLDSFIFLGIAYILHYVIYLVTIGFMFKRFYHGNLTMDNLGLFGLNVLCIVLIMFVKWFIDYWTALLICSLIVLFILYLSRKEYFLIFQSIFKKLHG